MTVTLVKLDKFELQVQNSSWNQKRMLPFFNPENYHVFGDIIGSMMTGDDSPTGSRKDEFHFGRSTPPPTTSYHPKHDHADFKSAAEVNREDKDKDKEKEKDKDKDKDDKDDVDVLKPGENPGYKPDEKDGDHRKGDSKSDQGDMPGKRGKDDIKGDYARDKECDEKKYNGDRLDGQWIPSSDAKAPPSDDEDDSNCTVKCLYYTMQCCECSIS